MWEKAVSEINRICVHIVLHLCCDYSQQDWTHLITSWRQNKSQYQAKKCVRVFMCTVRTTLPLLSRLSVCVRACVCVRVRAGVRRVCVCVWQLPQATHVFVDVFVQRQLTAVCVDSARVLWASFHFRSLALSFAPSSVLSAFQPSLVSSECFVPRSSF